MKEEKSVSQSSLPGIGNSWFDAEHMYETINNKQSEWGLEFYRVTPKYFDSRKEKQGKEPQSNIKIKYGERKHFLDDIAKQNCTPGPSSSLTI